jgi:hypothetical protein
MVTAVLHVIETAPNSPKIANERKRLCDSPPPLLESSTSLRLNLLIR